MLVNNARAESFIIRHNFPVSPCSRPLYVLGTLLSCIISAFCFTTYNVA